MPFTIFDIPRKKAICCLLVSYATRFLFGCVVGLMLSTGSVFAQGTSFAYQGKLSDAGTPANGIYDLQFKLFDTATLGTGTQQGVTLSVANVTVTNGLFTAQLDFGVCPSCFNGANRFLEISVKPDAGSVFTTLSPRQQITATPYALKSVNATSSDGLSVACVNCVTSSQIASVNGSAVTGAIPVGSLPAGSGNYIQNTASLQSSSNFNISGTGSASIFNASSQFNIGGIRVLSILGGNNIFAGEAAGSNNSSGFENSFFGWSAGAANTLGINNSFFGGAAGNANTTGGNNSFFGTEAGKLTTTASSNAFFGAQAGSTNTSGGSNSFFGRNAGVSNTTGSSNTFVGNTADAGSGNLINATAIGARAQVTQSNSLILGSINGINGATADTKVGIGTTAPGAPLDVQVAAGQSLQFRQDSGLVPGINVKTTGGNAGIMRLRNAVEVWPSDDLTRAGKVDIRNTSGSPTISLDGQSGNLVANNLPGIEFDVPLDPFDLGVLFFVDPGNTATVKTIVVNVPSDGFLVLIGHVLAAAQAGDSTGAGHGELQLFDETANTTFGSARFYVTTGYTTQTIQGVLAVSAGVRTLSLKMQCSNVSTNRLFYSSNTGSFIAMFFPKRY